MIVPAMNKARLFFLMRYLFAGLLAFTTNLSLFFMFINYFNMWYLTASTLAFILSVIVSFLAQKLVTFRDKTTDRVHHQAAMYITIALFNVAANGGFMFSFVDLVYMPYMFAQVLSAGIIAVWSLAVYRYVIFKHAIL
ncbi:MAG: hypothetical protein UY07_C0003G0010 [Parcubacteria group bacterium GW2011_GWA1_47_8]|nr:MAG: hypothetical protein UY07_C0003G0010 [Parcubacteria group bacterium GW2011_GWA1_47_8]